MQVGDLVILKIGPTTKGKLGEIVEVIREIGNTIIYYKVELSGNDRKNVMCHFWENELLLLPKNISKERIEFLKLMNKKELQ